MENSFQIIWQNEFVGKIADVENDMWYLSGKWISENSARAKQFQDLLSRLESKVTMADPVEGTLIKIKNDERGTIFNCIALSLEHNKLFLRILSTGGSIEWALKNAK
jgi:hypothetical protein